MFQKEVQKNFLFYRVTSVISLCCNLKNDISQIWFRYETYGVLIR